MTKIPLSIPTFTQEMEEAAIDALRNEFFVMGESVFKFEEAFARFCGVSDAISVSSGTAAIQMALLGLGIGPGKNVWTTPMSFIATANAVRHTGADPIFGDVDPKTYLLDPSLEPAKTPDAILPVHLYGRATSVEEYREREPDVPIIEDACQAHGAKVGNRRTGAIGDVGCFSFYSTKNMTVGGDGGMITTEDPHLAERIRSLRDCGRSKSRYLHEQIGFTSRLNTVNAAIGIVQLRHLDTWNERRREIARRYDDAFRDLPGINLITSDTSESNVHHLYAIGVKDRQALQDHLAFREIQTGNHYPIPIHLQPPYQEHYGYGEGAFPIAERWSRETVSLPVYPLMEREQVDRVIEAVTEFVSLPAQGVRK